MTNTPQNFAALVQTWRDAVVAHKAACDRVAKEGETPELDTLQGDACHQESDAAHALAGARSTDPVLLRGHAELLEAEIDDLDPVSPQCTLAASIVAELRALADEREGRAPHPLLAAVDAAEAEADRFEPDDHETFDREAFDAACAALAEAHLEVMRSPDLSLPVLDKQVALAEIFIHADSEFGQVACEAFERNTRALARMIDRANVSPVMNAAALAAAAIEEYDRLEVEHDAMFTGPRGTDEGMTDAEKNRIDDHGNLMDTAAGKRRAWEEVAFTHPAQDLAAAAVHAVYALDCALTMRGLTAVPQASDYIDAQRNLYKLLWSILAVLPVDAVPVAVLRDTLGHIASPWTGAPLVKGRSRHDG